MWTNIKWFWYLPLSRVFHLRYLSASRKNRIRNLMCTLNRIDTFVVQVHVNFKTMRPIFPQGKFNVYNFIVVFFPQHYYKFYRERIAFSLQRSPLGRLLRPIWQNWSVSTTRSLHFYFILKNTNFKAKWTIFSYLGIHANSLSLPPPRFYSSIEW